MMHSFKFQCVQSKLSASVEKSVRQNEALTINLVRHRETYCVIYAHLCIRINTDSDSLKNIKMSVSEVREQTIHYTLPSSYDYLLTLKL